MLLRLKNEIYNQIYMTEAELRETPEINDLFNK